MPSGVSVLTSGLTYNNFSQYGSSHVFYLSTTTSPSRSRVTYHSVYCALPAFDLNWRLPDALLRTALFGRPDQYPPNPELKIGSLPRSDRTNGERKACYDMRRSTMQT
jgi:hypothetical protein